MAYHSKTYSLSDEVVAWLGTLKDDYGSVNKGLLAMIALCGNAATHVAGGVLGGRARQIVGEFDPPPAILPPVDNRPKNCFCKHCGERFAGAKYASICQGCKSGGHTLTPNECPLCGEGRGI